MLRPAEGGPGLYLCSDRYESLQCCTTNARINLTMTIPDLIGGSLNDWQYIIHEIYFGFDNSFSP